MINEREYVLERLKSTAESQPTDHPLLRIDRNTAQVYETGEDIDTVSPVPQRKEDLQRANLVHVESTSADSDVRGQEYHLDTSATVVVTVEGLYYGEYGHIDPDGDNAPIFETLVNDIRSRVLDDRTYPSVTGPDTYKHILLLSENDGSTEFRDYYTYEISFGFEKIEDL